VADGFSVVVEQLRAHARNVEAVRDRFGAVKAASAHITQNNNAYGFLCQWMPAVLENRHVEQNRLIAYVEQNLAMVAERLRHNADAYQDADRWALDGFDDVAAELGWKQ
jgi:hypothetical protein